MYKVYIFYKGEFMILKEKTVGILFLNEFYITEEILNEIKRLTKIKKANVITLINKDNLNNNEYKQSLIEKYENQIRNITSFEPIFINNHKITGELIKKFDILILVRLDRKIIHEMIEENLKDNIFKFIQDYKKTNKPLIIGINIESNSNIFDSLKEVELLYKKSNYFLIPFKEKNPITKPYRITFIPSYIVKTCEFALNGKQIEPIISFL